MASKDVKSERMRSKINYESNLKCYELNKLLVGKLQVFNVYAVVSVIVDNYRAQERAA